MKAIAVIFAFAVLWLNVASAMQIANAQDPQGLEEGSITQERSQTITTITTALAMVGSGVVGALMFILTGSTFVPLISIGGLSFATIYAIIGILAIVFFPVSIVILAIAALLGGTIGLSFIIAALGTIASVIFAPVIAVISPILAALGITGVGGLFASIVAACSPALALCLPMIDICFDLFASGCSYLFWFLRLSCIPLTECFSLSATLAMPLFRLCWSFSAPISGVCLSACESSLRFCGAISMPMLQAIFSFLAPFFSGLLSLCLALCRTCVNSIRILCAPCVEICGVLL